MKTAYSKADFDALTTFVAIADELSHEPFLSEDTHETVYNADSKDPLRPPLGLFTHPALLKSAAIAFRKLWQPDCYAYPTICQLIANRSVDANHRQAALIEIKVYPKQLAKKAMSEWSDLTVEEVFKLWFNTQIAHAGPKNAKKKKGQSYDLEDFDRVVQQLGRAKFEYMFRVRLRTIGGNIVLRCKDFVFPEYWSLLKEGYKPSFKVELALRNSPYPDQSSGISIDDHFWHLDKETTEETFLRLIERQLFAHLRSFLRGYYGNSKHALAAVSNFGSFDEVLLQTKAKIHGPGDKLPPDVIPAGGLQGMSLLGNMPGKLTLYSNRIVIFEEKAHEILRQSYTLLRKMLFEERMKQRPRNKWDAW